MGMRFASLHSHSTFSFMDGFGPVADHVERVADLGMSALALTEHGNVSSHVQLKKACDKLWIKPVFGIEAYTGGVSEETRSKIKWHLTILASTSQGYQALLKLTSRAWAEGFYQHPTISSEMLKDAINESDDGRGPGLIVLSGCTGSLLATTLVGGKGKVHPREREGGQDKAFEDALKIARWFRDTLRERRGQDGGPNYFLETQVFPDLAVTRELNPLLARIGEELSIPLCGTADVHYPLPEDNEMQVILHAAGRGSNTAEKQSQSWEYDVRLTYPESDEAVVKGLIGTGLSGAEAEQAWLSTEAIAERCDVTMQQASRLRFPVPSGETAETYIRKKCLEGWKYREVDKLPKEEQKRYAEQVKMELALFTEKDFNDYFLVLSDTFSAAKDHGVLIGPARGSSAASLVCYLLRITEVNPMNFPLMVFSRFVDHNRTDEPDVDSDFDDEGREWTRQYLIDKYGQERVAVIGNNVKYRGKNSIDDVWRVYQDRIPYEAKETVKAQIIERSGGDSRRDASLSDTVDTFPAIAQIFEDHPELWYATRLEGNYKTLGIHAAGVVISNDPITNFCAVYTRARKDKGPISVLSVDKYDSKPLGLLKIDTLGLTTMGMIRRALEMIDMSPKDFYRLPLDDPKTLDLFNKGDVVGIFQFEGRATRLVCKDVMPTKFMDLADINTLSRPGPLFSGATHRYVEAKHGRAPRNSFHPAVDAITDQTAGEIIYQEETLRIVKEVAGFGWADANDVRKIISDKLGQIVMEGFQERFVQGCQDTSGLTREEADRVWKAIATAGSYVFNVAHSISYAMLGYWQGWLKTNHPHVFYTASLQRLDSNDKARVGRLMRDALQHGVDIKPPTLNSGRTWSIAVNEHEERAVTAGFEQVPGIGEKMAEVIIKDREENGPFTSWSSLLRVKGIGPKKLETIRAAVDNDDPFGLQLIHNKLDYIRGLLQKGELGPLPLPTHRSDDIPTKGGEMRVVVLAVPLERNYQSYVENQRSRYGTDVEEIIANMKRPDLDTACHLRCIDDGNEDLYIRTNRWYYPRFKNILDELVLGRDLVLAQGVKRDGFGLAIHVENIWVIDPTD